MANQRAAWGIEIGANAIKAIRLERDGDQVSVSDFAVIPHKKVLTTPDLDQDEMIRLSLGQFISQKELEGEHLVMSVPGHAAFARFAKLPPVEPKKVPDIVKFEAVQQIPFPIDQVEWDYQTFTSEDSPEVEVGIFAITRERVQQRLGLYSEVGVAPEALTLSPVAVYNAMAYDQQLKAEAGPVVYLDIGTQATDVIVAEKGRCWIRTFPLGGTHFTEAIAESFKLSYSKAEKLKQEAASSKYAKQIMQAMRPVFTDLLADLQRSIGYYQSLHRENELTMMVGLGSTFKIPGLRKFLGQQLQINVLRLDEYKRITVTGREAAAFHENAVNMATAYGLALQGVGLASINANLVPVKSLREQMWHAKTKWFAAAAAIAIVGSAMTFYRPMMDQAAMEASEPATVRSVLDSGNALKREYQQAQQESNVGFTGLNMQRLLEYRTIWPYIVYDASLVLQSTNPQPELLSGDPEQILTIPPSERRLVELKRLDGQYLFDPQQGRRIAVTMEVQLSHDDPIEFLHGTVQQWLQTNAQRPGVPYRIIPETISLNPQRLQREKVSESGERQGQAGGGRSSGSGGAASGGGGRRGGGGIAAGGGGGIAGGGGGAISGGGGARSGGGWGEGGGSGRSGSGGSDDSRRLDEMAPIPSKPALYPPGSDVYIVPITFEVEILDANATDPEQRADAAATEGSSS